MKKKIKVLQVIPRLGYGGAETGCYDLAHFLPERGCKSFIITGGGELLRYIDSKKVSNFWLFLLHFFKKNYKQLIFYWIIVIIGFVNSKMY